MCTVHGENSIYNTEYLVIFKPWNMPLYKILVDNDHENYQSSPLILLLQKLVPKHMKAWI
jgi:hypothetical protein